MLVVLFVVCAASRGATACLLVLLTCLVVTRLEASTRFVARLLLVDDLDEVDLPEFWSLEDPSLSDGGAIFRVKSAELD